jgi:hypothetical protein
MHVKLMLVLTRNKDGLSGQLRIEQRLNEVGRGKLLLSSQTTREEWVDVLHELSSYDDDDHDSFDASCLYSLLRLKPATCS